MSGRRCAWLALAVLCAATSLRAQQPAVIDQEYEIKAAYLRFFGLYTQWPGAMGKANEFVLGVLGKDPFGDVLDKLAKEKTIDGKKIVIQRFKSLNDYKPCHLLFLCREDGGSNPVKLDDRLVETLKKIQGSPVMLVADVEGLAGKGAVAGFYIDDNKVKIAINPETAKSAGLKISSDLLRVAKIVGKGKDPG